jgi:hypothetical protein
MEDTIVEDLPAMEDSGVDKRQGFGISHQS